MRLEYGTHARFEASIAYNRLTTQLKPYGIDNILIAFKSFEEHLNHLNLVFERLRKAGLHLKPSKCHFLCEQVGYIISNHGIQPDPSKTDKVKNFLSVSFVGLASYYRTFVPHFAAVAAPLHHFTKGCSFLMVT